MADGHEHIGSLSELGLYASFHIVEGLCDTFDFEGAFMREGDVFDATSEEVDGFCDLFYGSDLVEEEEGGSGKEEEGSPDHP